MACLKIKERQTVIAVVGLNGILNLAVDILYGVNLIESWKRLDDLRVNAPEHAPCNFDVFLDHFYFNLIYTACLFGLYCVVDITKAVLLWIVVSRKKHSEFWTSLQAFSVFVLVGYWVFSFAFTPSLETASVIISVVIILWNIFLICGVLWHSWKSWVFKPEKAATTTECAGNGIKSHDQRSSPLDTIPAAVKSQEMRITDESKPKDENEQRMIVEGVNGASVTEEESEIPPTDPRQREKESLEDNNEEVAMPGNQHHHSNNAAISDFSIATPKKSSRGTQGRSSSLPDVLAVEDNNKFEMIFYRSEVRDETSCNDSVDGNVATAADVSRNDELMSSEDRKANVGGTWVSAVMAFFR